MRQLEFRGTALVDLQAFPPPARRAAGYQLDKVERGVDPSDWKPMSSVGTGVREIRLTSTDGAFRVVYVAKFADTVFVLHCFQKKSQKTAREDLVLAKARYRELIEELRR